MIGDQHILGPHLCPYTDTKTYSLCFLLDLITGKLLLQLHGFLPSGSKESETERKVTNFHTNLALVFTKLSVKPHSSVGLKNRRSLVRSPAQPIFFLRIDDSHCYRIHFSSPLSVVSTMLMWESSQWLGKNSGEHG